MSCIAVNRSNSYHKYFESNKNASFIVNELLDVSFGVRRLNIIGYEKRMGYSAEIPVYSEIGDDQLIKFSVYQDIIALNIEELKKM